MLHRASSGVLAQLASSGLAAMSAAHTSRRAVSILPVAAAAVSTSGGRFLSTHQALGQAQKAAA